MVSTYSTWDFYSNVFLGVLPKEQYTRLSAGAAKEIDRRTFGAAESAPESMIEALQYCECELVDTLFAFERSFSLIPDGLIAINNDGFSASTAPATNKGNGRTEAQSEKARLICQRWLLRPVNLLYAGVGGC